MLFQLLLSSLFAVLALAVSFSVVSSLGSLQYFEHNKVTCITSKDGLIILYIPSSRALFRSTRSCANGGDVRHCIRIADDPLDARLKQELAE